MVHPRPMVHPCTMGATLATICHYEPYVPSFPRHGATFAIAPPAPPRPGPNPLDHLRHSEPARTLHLRRAACPELAERIASSLRRFPLAPWVQHSQSHVNAQLTSRPSGPMVQLLQWHHPLEPHLPQTHLAPTTIRPFVASSLRPFVAPSLPRAACPEPAERIASSLPRWCILAPWVQHLQPHANTKLTARHSPVMVQLSRLHHPHRHTPSSLRRSARSSLRRFPRRFVPLRRSPVQRAAFPSSPSSCISCPRCPSR
jgi:hypothetical protein